MSASDTYVEWFDELGAGDVENVGGKNASLGEMIRSLKAEGVRVPDGFATTAASYWKFLEANGLNEKIEERLAGLHSGEKSLEQTGKSIRRLFGRSEFPKDMATSLEEACGKLCDRYNKEDVDVAVRSSATAEDLADASFAGQQETFLNVTGEEELLDACRKCFASLFTDRAISYRNEKGFDHMKVALSVGAQKMVRSDKSGSGVMFSIDTETGFRDVVVINAAWGLGENVVQGTVTPDEYRVFKPLLADGRFKPIIEKALGEKEKKMVYARGDSRTTKNVNTSKKDRRRFVLSDGEILKLAAWATAIEHHYGKAMDIEWAKDGETDELMIVQARPETVQSQKKGDTLKTYNLKEKGKSLLQGRA